MMAWSKLFTVGQTWVGRSQSAGPAPAAAPRRHVHRQVLSLGASADTRDPAHRRWDRRNRRTPSCARIGAEARGGHGSPGSRTQRSVTRVGRKLTQLRRSLYTTVPGLTRCMTPQRRTCITRCMRKAGVPAVTTSGVRIPVRRAAPPASGGRNRHAPAPSLRRAGVRCLPVVKYSPAKRSPASGSRGSGATGQVRRAHPGAVHPD
jgi:hypothetical protein